MNAARSKKPRPPTKTEQAARHAAEAGAGGPAPPRAEAPGFDGLVGQQSAIEGLRRALDAGRLPHAILLHGPRGVGKATCAGVVAQALNCPTLDHADACGDCRSCRKVARGLHPDVLWVEPQKGMIRLAQITHRGSAGGDARPPHEPIASWVGYRPYEGSRRVIVIDEAHAMNPAAQNALLKTLEEPPPSSLLLLVTPAPRRLLPTIRSRCQALRFDPLPLGLLREHLERSHGFSADEARLRAALAPGSLGVALAIDIDEYRERRDAAETAVADARQGGAALLAAAEALLAAGLGERKIDQATSAIGALRDVLRDLLVLAAGSEDRLLVNVDRAEDWRGWAAELEPDALVTALSAVQRADDTLHSPLIPNVRLTVEEALVGVGAALRAGTTG